MDHPVLKAGRAAVVTGARKRHRARFVIRNHPALSRWHPEWAERFEEFMRHGTPQP